MRRIPSRTGVLTLAALVLASSTAACEPDEDILVPVGCHCYYPDQCLSGQFCDWGAGCTHAGKLDGSCTGPVSTGGPFDPLSSEADARKAVELVELAFRAYEAPIRKGGGHPEARLWAEVEASAPSSEVGAAIRQLTNGSLDATLGFDFNLATGESTGPGNIRLVENQSAMLALVGATRSAIVRAIVQGDSSAVDAPLQTFWKEHPDYQPAHTGRCYSHGHAEFETLYDSALDCQVRALERLMVIVLKSER